MMYHDLSQLPVMQGERSVKGVISWYSIGARRTFGCSSNFVRDYMDPPQEIGADASLFEAIPLIVKHQYVLVRDAQNKIGGIVTASDLGEQFGQLGEPFLLIGEIENHIRNLIVGKFTADELAANRDPADETREVEKVDDLAFGEYRRLLENEDHWGRLDLDGTDRRLFIKQLENIRLVRNRAMHFDSDGLADEDMERLRRFAGLLRKLHKMGEV
jgi:hypothetical protein